MQLRSLFHVSQRQVERSQIDGQSSGRVWANAQVAVRILWHVWLRDA